MLNGLADFGDQDGLSFQAGLGFGWNKVKLINDKDGAWAWQAILGLQYAVSPNMDFGVRYKYFSTGQPATSATATSQATRSPSARLDPDPACWRAHQVTRRSRRMSSRTSTRSSGRTALC